MQGYITMAKNKQASKEAKAKAKAQAKRAKQQQQLLWIGAIVALIAVIGGVVFYTSSDADANAEKITAQEYRDDFSNTDHILIDVRTSGEYGTGYIPGAINIPVEELANRLDEVPKDVPVVLYCRSGNRSADASEILLENGFTDVYDLGGIQDWNYDIVR